MAKDFDTMEDSNRSANPSIHDNSCLLTPRGKASLRRQMPAATAPKIPIIAPDAPTAGIAHAAQHARCQINEEKAARSVYIHSHSSEPKKSNYVQHGMG